MKEKQEINIQKWEKWQKALDKIEDELRRLRTSRRTFLKVREIFKNDKDPNPLSEEVYYNWLEHNYCVRIAMSIRRLIDNYSREMNIGEFLKDILENTDQINIDICTQREMLEKSDVENDLDDLKTFCKPIKDYVDKYFAHMDNVTVPVPTIEEGHKAIDTLVGIYNKYSLILCRNKLSFPDDNILFGDV